MTTKNTYSHLVWLGAGTATEPQGLTDKAEHLIFIEARDDACYALQKNYPDAQVLQQLLALDERVVEFTQYNLAAYSAIQPATGIKNLFPGLKPITSKQLPTVTLSQSIEQLKLQGNQHCLVIDLPDISLSLLKPLAQTKLLNAFNTIYVKASTEELYRDSATTNQMQTWLQEQGYINIQQDFSDPDMPWLCFSINPLWRTLLEAQQKNEALANDLKKVSDQLIAAQQEITSNKLTHEHKDAEISKLHQTLEQQIADANQAKQDSEQQLAQIKQQFTIAQQDLLANKQNAEQAKVDQQQLTQLKQQLSAAQEELLSNNQSVEKLKSEQQQLATQIDQHEKVIANLNKEIEEKEKKNSALIENEKKLQQKLSEQEYRNNNLNLEVSKLAAQIELITNVILKEKAF